jgi:K+-transporting ATPase A subunit
LSGQGISQIIVYAIVLIALSYPLGLYMARVYAPGFRVGRETLYRLLYGNPSALGVCFPVSDEFLRGLP